jgi:hypothetical protein
LIGRAEISLSFLTKLQTKIATLQKPSDGKHKANTKCNAGYQTKIDYFVKPSDGKHPVDTNLMQANMEYNKQTSLITILSSPHGRLRREQRDIDKRDLQKAIKHGTRYFQHNTGNWLVTYDGIIFIVDKKLKREVTVFPAPLATAPVTLEDDADHMKAKEVIKLKPELCNSHTVLVIDNSGSMRERDIALHRDRQIAAYTLTALEFIAEQLFNNTANNSDVVSLVEFSNKATIIFEREPVSWVLFNKLLSRRDKRTYIVRELYKNRDALSCDSNYIPALVEAHHLLKEEIHEDCALHLFFLSDGAPTDSSHLKIGPNSALEMMTAQIKDIALEFSERLDITMVGFGNTLRDFKALEIMIEAAKEASPQSNSTFVYCDKIADSISEAITTAATSLATKRTSLMGRTMPHQGYTRRNIERESKSHSAAEWRLYRIIDHFIFNPRLDDWKHFPGLPLGSRREGDNEMINDRLKAGLPIPPYVAVRNMAIDAGLERVAFRCRLSDEPIQTKFVFGPMVAKETDHIDLISKNIEFHKIFCQTQSLAGYLAHEFSNRLQALPDFSASTTPRITFLPCSVLLVEDPTWPGEERGFLVEKELDYERYRWCKWNDNAGMVDGRVAHIPIDVEHEFAQLEKGTDMVIKEGDDDDDDDDDGDDDDDDDEYSDDEDLKDEMLLVPTTEIDDSSLVSKPSDYLQAFSHFTYLFTKGKILVCDLQGVYNTDMIPPTFELSDPVIHYRSKNRNKVCGVTDRGQKGHQLFFNTHQCGKVCKFMQLSKKNPEWQEHWHKRSEESQRKGK